MSTGDFARAAEHLRRGHLGAADGWCRRGLETAADDPAGLNLLGCIAVLAGQQAAARAAFTAALPLAAARDNLELLAGEEPMPARTGPGFVLIKSWGYGFCAELATSLVILVASQLGLPTSSSQCIIGASVGVGESF